MPYNANTGSEELRVLFENRWHLSCHTGVSFDNIDFECLTLLDLKLPRRMMSVYFLGDAGFCIKCDRYREPFDQLSTQTF